MVDCIHYIEGSGGCRSSCAPRTLFFFPLCLLEGGRKDRRQPAGCLVQQRHPAPASILAKPEGPPNQMMGSL